MRTEIAARETQRRRTCAPARRGRAQVNKNELEMDLVLKSRGVESESEVCEDEHGEAEGEGEGEGARRRLDSQCAGHCRHSRDPGLRRRRMRTRKKKLPSSSSPPRPGLAGKPRLGLDSARPGVLVFLVLSFSFSSSNPRAICQRQASLPSKFPPSRYFGIISRCEPAWSAWSSCLHTTAAGSGCSGATGGRICVA